MLCAFQKVPEKLKSTLDCFQYDALSVDMVKALPHIKNFGLLSQCTVVITLFVSLVSDDDQPSEWHQTSLWITDDQADTLSWLTVLAS